jgi:hypothetical protein
MTFLLFSLKAVVEFYVLKTSIEDFIKSKFKK